MKRKDNKGVPVNVRFFEKVEQTDTCWNWTAAKDEKGYGLFRTGGAQKHMSRAHRFSYELHVAPIPAGLLIDHICHNTSCVNPSHLRVVTNKQNTENLIGANSNSKSGVRGVHWHKECKKWAVRVGHNGRVLYGGVFADLADAEAAAVAMRNRLFTHNDLDRAA